MLPMMPGVPERTHDYSRHGTTTLFAAPQHRHRQSHRWSRNGATVSRSFCSFLCAIDEAVPKKLEAHLVMHTRNHKTPTVKRWLARNWRFHVTTPTLPWLS